MKWLKDRPAKSDSPDMLADVRTLSLVIARLKLHLEACSDKKRKKQYNALLSSLSSLKMLRTYIMMNEGQTSVSEQTLYIDGLPRWIFQITSQFGHYVNPESTYREKWQARRTVVWSGIESSIPASVRDLLLSWRWKAEIAAFRKILAELQISKDKVNEIDRQFNQCEKSSSHMALNLGVFDRFRILKWAGESKKIEAALPRLEEMKLKKQKEIADVLAECEQLAARISFEMKTALVDCGGYYPVVYEECTRTVDNEIRKDISRQFVEKYSENEIIKGEIDRKNRTGSDDFKKTNDFSSQFGRRVSGEWDKKLAEAQSLIEREFLCLNSIEIQQQEDAHIRWKNAVREMNELVRTAEESLIHGR